MTTAGSWLTHPPPHTATFLCVVGTPKIYRSFFTFCPSTSPGLGLGRLTVDTDHLPLHCITLQKTTNPSTRGASLAWIWLGCFSPRLSASPVFQAPRWSLGIRIRLCSPRPVRRRALPCACPLPPATASSVLSHGVTTVPKPGLSVCHERWGQPSWMWSCFPQQAAAFTSSTVYNPWACGAGRCPVGLSGAA